MCIKLSLKERHEREQNKDKCVPSWVLVPFDERHKLKSGTRVRRYFVPTGSDHVEVHDFWMDSDIFLTKGYNGRTTTAYMYHDEILPGQASIGKRGYVGDLFRGEVWMRIWSQV